MWILSKDLETLIDIDGVCCTPLYDNDENKNTARVKNFLYYILECYR